MGYDGKENQATKRTLYILEETNMHTKKTKLSDEKHKTLTKKKKLISIPVEYEIAIKEIQENSNIYEYMGTNVEFYILEAVREALKRDGY